MPTPSLDDWIALIERFVNGSIRGDEFANSYFSLEQQEYEASKDGQPSLQPSSADWILYDFFGKVDRLSTDAQPREDALTPEELRREAESVLAKLEQIADDPSRGPGAAEKVLRLALASMVIAGGALAFLGYTLWRTGRWLGLKTVRPFRRD